LGVRVDGITTILDVVIHDGHKSNKEAENRLLNARPVGLGKLSKSRADTRGTITAIVRLTLAIRFNMIIPQGVKNNGTLFWSKA
jgi:hypothetical protein